MYFPLLKSNETMMHLYFVKMRQSYIVRMLRKLKQYLKKMIVFRIYFMSYTVQGKQISNLQVKDIVILK